MQRFIDPGLFIVIALVAGQLNREAKAAEVLTPCFLKFSLYENIPGDAVDDFVYHDDYPDNPSQVLYLRSFDTRDALPGDNLDEYGGRIEGLLTPQESGSYTFFLRSDNASELWLSSDDTELRANIIAEEEDCCDPFMEPESGDYATSLSVELTAGKRYFILVEYKEDSGGDYAQVAWRLADDPTPAAELKPIPAAFLSTYVDDSSGPEVTITQQPRDTAGEENDFATFTVAAETTPSAPVCIQWQRNGVSIPDATGSTLTTLLAKADQGAAYRAVVAVPGAFSTSEAATVSVTDDTTPPELLGGKGIPNQPEVTLTFSERVSQATATALSNYRIGGPDGDLEVLGAALSPDDTRVTLTTGPQTVGTEYTVTVNGVTDVAANANPIANDSQTTFFAVGRLLQGEDGFVVWEAEDYDRNLDELWIADFTRGTPSGGVSMIVPNGAGGSEQATRLEYDIVFTQTGTHILWYRAGADAGEDDSAWLHVDGERPPNRVDANQASMAGFNGSIWEWNSNPQDGPSPMSFEIDSPGLHTIGLARREDGAFFDKFVITTDSNFDPEDYGEFGPPLTLREGEPPVTGCSVEFTLQPTDTEGLENASLAVSAGAEVGEECLTTTQWQRRQGDTFTDIAGATLQTLTIEPLKLSWDGAVVRMRVISSGITEYSDEATLSVVPETTPPALLRASGAAATRRVMLVFSEPLDPGTAEQAENYSLSGSTGALAVNSATLLPSGFTVLLTTGAQTVGAKYTVTVNGVTDTAATPNPLVNGQAKYYSLGELLPQSDDGLLVFEAESYTDNLDGLWVEDSQRATPSGGVSMVLPNGAGGSETASRLEYDLTFTQTGTHIIWYRAGADNGSDDSAWLHVDGARPPNREGGNQASMTGFNEVPGFAWRSQPQDGDSPFTFEIDSTGQHTIGAARREDGAYFDKFAITTDSNFHPEDFGPFGPPETRAGAPPMPTIAVTSPASGSEFEDGANISMTVEISDTSRVVSKVEYFAGANLIGESFEAPYAFAWNEAETGGYVITATLTDDVGDSVRSVPALVMVGEPNDVLFLVGDADLDAVPGDAAMRDHLETFGFRVIVVEDVFSQELDAFGKVLIVDSSTVTSDDIGAKFRDAEVPVFVWEQLNQDDFGMTGDVEGVDLGTIDSQTEIEIVTADHPMAAGFPTGVRTVALSPQEFSFGKPNENAIRIATVPESPDQVVLYGYEAGTEMIDGFIAPARRVEVFLTDEAFTALNGDGIALIDAALSWALDRELAPGAGNILVTATLGTDGMTMTLTWEGGAPPFGVLKKRSLSDAVWENVTTTETHTATVPVEGASGFFRIVEQ